MAAKNWFFLSDVNGVRQRQEQSGYRHPHPRGGEAKQLIDEGVIDAGMIPKVEACLETPGLGSARFISLMVE